ncbi:MAG: cytidylate kinase-like family protein [Desulfobacterales bacterium]|uniref:Cytidylate kinase-like family protein n=1 Tax=Candidatus Desulfatibia vada TaxID=2841696 RepID=A0A8J6TJ34_9BACT|nr:cytidylate kinase-like family protein [Candidatus Desulfatibia vada]
MKTRTRSIHQIIEEQVQKWQILDKKEKKEAEEISVVTISREPGSGGNIVAKSLSEKLDFDLFYQEVIHEMAESARVSVRLLETLDEKGVSVLEDWISSLVDKRHLWPDRYLQHLMKVIGTIGKHGRAVIVGRGANFVLPPDKRLSVRIVAPLEIRIKNVTRDFGIDKEEARRRVVRTDSDRRAFVRKYFNADIRAPLNYDLVINIGILSIEGAVDAIKGALSQKSKG